MNHFDEMTAFLYLDGQLERTQASEVLTHTTQCMECHKLLESLKKETLWLEQSLQEKDPVPVRFQVATRHVNLRWGWATALAMAIAGMLTVWNGVVEPFEHQLNQAGFSGGNLMTMLLSTALFWKGWPTMLNFLGFFAATVFCIFAIMFARRFWRSGTVIGMVISGFLAAVVLMPMLLVAPGAQASEMVHGHPSYTLPAGQTVDTDLFVAGDFVRISGTVNGDVIAWGNEVEIDGHVAGDVIAMSRELRINGQVDGNIRGYTQTLDMNGSVSKNVLATCQDFEMSASSKIGGSLTMAAGNAMISGTVARGIAATVGDTTLDGAIGSNVNLRGDHLHISSRANIQGPVKYTGRHEADVDSSAKLASPVTFIQRKEGPDYSNWKFYWHRAEFWGAAFLFGLVLLFLLPGFFSDGVQAGKKFFPSLGFGVLFFVATPIVALLICFTVVGIGVAIPSMLLWLVSIYAAQVFVAGWVGETLLGPAVAKGALVGRLALGLAIIHGLEMVPYHIGFIIHLIVFWWGLGAIAIAVYRHLHRAAVIPSPVLA